jgi:hypothetical protein
MPLLQRTNPQELDRIIEVVRSMAAAVSPADAPLEGTLRNQLRLEEFKILRGEIELRSSEGRAMERNVILIASGIYGFLLAPKGVSLSENTMFLELAWYLVPIFSFLSFIRWRDSGDLIRALADYIRENVETDIPNGGWETFLDGRRGKRKNPMVSAGYALFWIVCIVGSLVVAWLRYPLADTDWPLTAWLIGIFGSVLVLAMLGPERMDIQWRPKFARGGGRKETGAPHSHPA